MLLPHSWRFLAIALLIAGLFFSVLYLLFDFVVKAPVFAVYSAFLETNMFVSFTTNITDELTMTFLLAGLGLFVFSKEKSEDKSLDLLRNRALGLAALVNTAFLLFSVLFVYGTGFIAILVINLFSPLLFYLVFFHIQKGKAGSKTK